MQIINPNSRDAQAFPVALNRHEKGARELLKRAHVLEAKDETTTASILRQQATQLLAIARRRTDYVAY